MEFEGKSYRLKKAAGWLAIKATRTEGLHPPAVASPCRLQSEVDPQFDTGLDSFLNFFVSGRSLRQAVDLVSYYHPRAEAAFASIVRGEHVRSSKLIGQLLEVLTQVDEAGGWGCETAAHILVVDDNYLGRLTTTILAG